MTGPHVRVREDALSWDPADVEVPPLPEVSPGDDPMSALIAAIMPELSAIIAEQVAATREREERFAGNVTGARSAYQNTDGAGQQLIRSAAESPGISPAAVPAGAPPAQPGQFGQFGQLMSTAMQMASQAAQLPMQIAGMAAAVPQGIMQGAMQQFDQATGQHVDLSAASSDERREDGDAERTPDEHQPGQDREARRDGADTGGQQSERVPGTGSPAPPPNAETPSPERIPAPTRPPGG